MYRKGGGGSKIKVQISSEGYFCSIYTLSNVERNMRANIIFLHWIGAVGQWTTPADRKPGNVE